MTEPRDDDPSDVARQWMAERQVHNLERQLSDCERNLQRAVQDLGALEKLRAHPKRAVLIALLEHDRDEWAEREAGYMVPLLDELTGLLQPGEVSRVVVDAGFVSPDYAAQVAARKPAGEEGDSNG